MGQVQENDDIERKGGLFNYISIRYMIAALCFIVLFLEYSVKVCMSVLIVAMVKTDSNEKANVSSFVTVATEENDVCPGTTDTESVSESNGEFDWDEQLQGYILGATGYGIVITHIIGGRLSEKFGPKYVIGPSVFLIGLFTVLCPLFARLHVVAFISLRVLIGLSSGTIIPALQVIIARWYTVKERQFITSIIYASLTLCTVESLSASGLLADGLGWPFVFYLFGGLNMVSVIPWFLFVYDNPESHPYISEKEKNLIMTNSRQRRENKASATVPWFAMLTSVPVWAHIVFAFGHLWSTTTLTSQLPTYLSRILHFNLKESGLTSAVPFIFSLIGGIFFGYLGQKARLSGYISPLNSLHLFNTICGVLAPIILFIVTVIGCDSMATMVLLCCSQFASTAYYGGSIINNLDLASNFAGTISGISTTIVSTASIVSPIIVGSLTENNQTLTQWHIVFYISISLTLASYVIFTIFGSLEEQPWNKIETENHESQSPVDISKKQEDV